LWYSVNGRYRTYHWRKINARASHLKSNGLKSISYDKIVYIGRFQPIHNGHLQTIRTALRMAKKIILVIGSHRRSRSVKNPWTADERKNMILSCLTKAEQKRVSFVFIRDRVFNETLWNSNVINEVSFLSKAQDRIGLIGHEKDASSYYIKTFPQWELIVVDNYKNLNSTDIRQKLFSNQKTNAADVPKSIATYLTHFKKTDVFKNLKAEFDFLKRKKETTKEESFVLIQSGYVWLLKRKTQPGKNLFCLPNSSPTTKPPDNSLVCPAVAYDKKKHEGKWVLLDDLCLMEDQFFADHFQILSYFLKNNKTPSSV